MSKRRAHRARYIEGWNSMDAEKLLASVTEDFVFDDPADPAPITKAALAAYMPRWPEKAAALGATFQFDIVDKVIEDRGRSPARMALVAPDRDRGGRIGRHQDDRCGRDVRTPRLLQSALAAAQLMAPTTQVRRGVSGSPT